MNWTGLALGLWMLAAIGVGFWWVIKVEYYLGAQVWPWVLALGVALAVASYFVPSFGAAAAVGVLAGSVIWGSTELPAQAERVRRGLFPSNPRRKEGR